MRSSEYTVYFIFDEMRKIFLLSILQQMILVDRPIFGFNSWLASCSKCLLIEPNYPKSLCMDFYVTLFVIVCGWCDFQVAFFVVEPSKPKMLYVGVIRNTGLKYFMSFPLKFLSFLQCIFSGA